jgi:hypothetical protein
MPTVQSSAEAHPASGDEYDTPMLSCHLKEIQQSTANYGDVFARWNISREDFDLCNLNTMFYQLYEGQCYASGQGIFSHDADCMCLRVGSPLSSSLSHGKLAMSTNYLCCRFNKYIHFKAHYCIHLFNIVDGHRQSICVSSSSPFTVYPP